MGALRDRFHVALPCNETREHHRCMPQAADARRHTARLRGHPQVGLARSLFFLTFSLSRTCCRLAPGRESSCFRRDQIAAATHQQLRPRSRRDFVSSLRDGDPTFGNQWHLV